MVLTFVLNGGSCYFVLRLFKFSVTASFVGALFFTISAPVMLKTGHFRMVPRFIVPLMFYAGIKFVEKQKVKYFYLFASVFVYQFYIGIYIGFFQY